MVSRNKEQGILRPLGRVFIVRGLQTTVKKGKPEVVSLPNAGSAASQLQIAGFFSRKQGVAGLDSEYCEHYALEATIHV